MLAYPTKCTLSQKKTIKSSNSTVASKFFPLDKLISFLIRCINSKQCDLQTQHPQRCLNGPQFTSDLIVFECVNCLLFLTIMIGGLKAKKIKIEKSHCEGLLKAGKKRIDALQGKRRAHSIWSKTRIRTFSGFTNFVFKF